MTTRASRACAAASLFLAVVATAIPGVPAAAATTSAWAWGDNTSGQLGDGTTIGAATPGTVSGLVGVTSVAAGDGHSLALLDDGTVVAWGDNTAGQLGDGTTNDSPSPVAVAGLSGVTAVAAGNFHSLALLADGTVAAWGANNNGQLGGGGATFSPTPVAVPGLSGVTAIAAGGGHSLALLADGSVIAWGLNQVGQVGNGSTSDSSPPTTVSGLAGVTAIAAGLDHSLALLADGTVVAWGWNGSGQLGDGSNTDSPTPVPVAGLAGVAEIAAGSFHSLGRLTDGTVRAWGANQVGQLGDGTSTLSSTSPVAVVGLSDAVGVAAGEGHSLALRANGTVVAWGDNTAGQLGDGTTSGSSTPVAVAELTGISAIAAGANHSLAVQAPGGAGAANVTASVTMALPPEACVLVDTPALDFGELAFGATATSPGYAVSSCSEGTQDLFAHATDATNSSGTLTWTPSVTPATDQFGVDVNLLDGSGRVALTGTAIPVGSLAPGAVSASRDHTLTAPPPGSNGAGETMTFDIVWTAVVSN